MASSQKNPGYIRVLSHPVAVVILACAVIYVASSVFRIAVKSREAKENKNEILAELESLKEREASLVIEIARLETDEGLEEALRENFRIAKEGEGVIMIVDPDTAESHDGTSRQNQRFREFVSNFFNFKK